MGVKRKMRGSSHSQVKMQFNNTRWKSVMLYLLFSCLNTETYSPATGQVNPCILRKRHRHTFPPSCRWAQVTTAMIFTFIYPNYSGVFSIKKYDDNWDVCNYPALLTLKCHLDRTSSTTHYSTKFTINYTSCCCRYETNTSPTLEGRGRIQCQGEISR